MCINKLGKKFLKNKNRQRKVIHTPTKRKFQINQPRKDILEYTHIPIINNSNIFNI